MYSGGLIGLLNEKIPCLIVLSVDFEPRIGWGLGKA